MGENGGTVEEWAPAGLSSDGQKNAHPVRSAGAVDYVLLGKDEETVKAEGPKCLGPSWSLDCNVSEDELSCRVWTQFALGTRIPDALERFSFSRAVAL